MKNIIIVCDDSFGLDVKRIIQAVNQYWDQQGWGIPYRIKGYIGNIKVPDDIKGYFSPYLGTISQWVPEKDDCFAMGIVEPHRKKEAVELLKAKGAQFETLWAPWVLAHMDMEFPEGCIIAAQSIMDSARIGRFTTLYHAMIGFDAVIGDYSSIMSFANITTAHIGDRVYFGDNAVVIEKTIHDDAVVMPNSVVVKEVKAGTTVMGNPARKIKS